MQILKASILLLFLLASIATLVYGIVQQLKEQKEINRAVEEQETHVASLKGYGYMLIALLLAACGGFANNALTKTENLIGDETRPDAHKTAESFRYPEKTLVVGNMEEILDWINGNDVTSVQSIIYVEDTENLRKWRKEHPEGIPSETVRKAHDNERMLYVATIPNNQTPAQ